VQAVDPDGEGRYTVLETIREFAEEALVAGGEEDVIRAAHAAYFLDLVERAEAEFYGQDQRRWFDCLTAEHVNLRATLEFLERTDRDAELVRLTTLLWRFWWFKGYQAEAFGWFERAVARQAGALPAARVELLLGAARLNWNVGDVDRADDLVRQVQVLGVTGGTPDIEGMCGLVLGAVTAMRGDAAGAARQVEDALLRFRAAGDALSLSMALNYALFIAKGGDLARGTALVEEGLALHRARGDRLLTGGCLSDVGVLAHDAGDEHKARRCYAESVRLLYEVGATWYMASGLAGLATIAAAREPVRAARLLGAAAALRELSGVSGWPTEAARDERAVTTASAILGAAVFEREVAAGRAMSPAEALAEAEAVAIEQPVALPLADARGSLTERELEVLLLLVAGRSDREIGEALFISPRTASKHVANILAKLDAGTRGEAAVLAVRAGLV
jgi:DNA-binding CsgD family transcriptional regulator